jgi:hypothetical protein
MINLINKLIAKNRRKVFRPKNHRPLTMEWYIRFRCWGEGLYYANIQSRNNNLVAKIIAKFSKGLTHSIAILYSEDLEKHFTIPEWERIKQNWNHYYGYTKTLDEDIKVLVLASADENGLNFLDFGNYQRRQLSLRKVKIFKMNERRILKYLVSRSKKIYDYTGLIFFWLHKTFKFFGFLDDPEADWCSESIYDAFKKGGIFIADRDNPSPAEIEDYNERLLLYSNLTIKENYLKKR